MLLEAQLSASSPLVGKTLREAQFPPDSLVVSLMRQGDTYFPHGDTRLEAGDLIMVMADPDIEAALRSFLGDTKLFVPGDPLAEK